MIAEKIYEDSPVKSSGGIRSGAGRERTSLGAVGMGGEQVDFVGRLLKGDREGRGSRKEGLYDAAAGTKGYR